ncbi:hypothetical protein CLAFUW4_08888 [Fulvia fulva]|uniref:Uncharacterized protein n=1 Tax=Passalora fulva TaxID=5499 RepID=A0A9Q8UTJ9_PASFU|nr:uncharacterized protein CLAFUR5_08994 [Fulvia fulva]KAK4613859.1 hypothetical protein CLAFUR4_08894 [Fulvia fulva]KAK4614947.1 hypothetical protein CLAFUR0_08886 [Fulvia fulva]UJO21956.1 hypothetical protein CLAFUR5_08994 [Fulvia fulva]WPV20102.1 hypothetical protein CLAFUW4_08888 [Fulvia fulva]WPV35106.1 hypothetical protein CLAFUW7_08889 [Fulvia fulva]
MAQPHGTRPCFLLDLAPELRNMIYELILCDSSTALSPDSKPRVLIDKDTITQPPLLQTCLQIRAEASGIYYFGNRFDVVCLGFDPTDMILLTRQAKDITISVKVHDTQTAPKWANVFKWLQAYYNNEVGRLEEVWDAHCEAQQWNSVAKMFDMVDMLKNRQMPWREMEKVLEVTKDIAQLSVDWEWEEED